MLSQHPNLMQDVIKCLQTVASVHIFPYTNSTAPSTYVFWRS